MARLPNTPIIVDEFKYIPGCFIYLLTHLHTDHTGGLTPSWNNGIIFCSEITKRLLLKKFQLQEPERIIALEEGPTYYIPLVPPSPMQDHTDTNLNIHHDVNIWRDPSYWVKFNNNPSSSQNNSSNLSQSMSVGMNQALTVYDKDTSYMQVNIIDANHCPGSIMFLLEGYFGNVLFTGDFRYDARILQAPCFRDKKIDHLYLDDTFLDKMYDFPTRQEAGKQVISVIKSLPDTTHILIAVDHLGKEELMLALATTFQTLIVVPEERYELLECMNDIIPIDLFTCDPKQGRIFVKSKKEVNMRSIIEHKRIFGATTVGIIPSGWSSAQLKDPTSQLIYRVPYSLHSSYSEIIEFVSTLKPKNVYSTSKDENLELRDQVGKYCDYNTPLKPVIVPRSVLSHMERSSNMIDHKKITSVSNISPSSSITKVYRKRKSYPPSHKKFLKIIPQNTQTQNTSIIDLTDTVNTSQINLEDTQDLLSHMYNRSETSFSLPSTPNKKKESQRIVGSLEVLDVLDNFVNISPIPSPKIIKHSPHRKQLASKHSIEQVLVDNNGIPILVPKDTNLESDEIYNLSLSPHSGDENAFDESEILNNIDLEQSPEESIIIKTANNQQLPSKKRKHVETRQILELSDDDEIVLKPATNKTTSHYESNTKKLKLATNLSQIEFSLEANPVVAQDEIDKNEPYPQGYSQISWDDSDEDVKLIPHQKNKTSQTLHKTTKPTKQSSSLSLTDIFFPKATRH
ncbi:hypothetical protein NAEGRDRAFT_59473 [Naegleria gruberi]|uniref:Protein artemis n=1 Tax=Naegleria gruberi TaxID=5762 RepID=D2VX66_NAEGR|nr:uncharacterized protein NAEGRDRAFT_59473 [Naegleria gruberi]EFC38573.1 hypothetical protein NAEGRDRAFT_59473 [Naegleria gruberi]|eukprot:XP_002671317.1 hypothetical protein NAEGRDRAFT_59473 [Naegleria gruberi strain NEG-M]